jgi:hypothetical protein
MLLFLLEAWLVSGLRAGSSWLVIANELSWLYSARYSRAEQSRTNHKPSRLTSFLFFVHPYSWLMKP